MVWWGATLQLCYLINGRLPTATFTASSPSLSVCFCVFSFSIHCLVSLGGVPPFEPKLSLDNCFPLIRCYAATRQMVWITSIILCTEDCAYAMRQSCRDRCFSCPRKMVIILDCLSLMSEWQITVRSILVTLYTFVADDSQTSFHWEPIRKHIVSSVASLSFGVYESILVAGLWMSSECVVPLQSIRLVPSRIGCSALSALTFWTESWRVWAINVPRSKRSSPSSD